MGGTDITEIRSLDEAIDGLRAGAIDPPAEIAGLVGVAAGVRDALAERPDVVWVPARHARRLRYASAAVAAVLVLTVGAGSAFAASASSLPGQPLYGVKTAFERAALAMRSSSHGRVAFEWTLTRRRLAELQAVAGTPAAEHARLAYEAALARAERSLGASDALMLDQIDDELQHHVTVLNGLLSTVPEQAVHGIQNAIDHANEAEQRVRSGRDQTGNGRGHGRGHSGR